MILLSRTKVQSAWTLWSADTELRFGKCPHGHSTVRSCENCIVDFALFITDKYDLYLDIAHRVPCDFLDCTYCLKWKENRKMATPNPIKKRYYVVLRPVRKSSGGYMADSGLSDLDHYSDIERAREKADILANKYPGRIVEIVQTIEALKVSKAEQVPLED